MEKIIGGGGGTIKNHAQCAKDGAVEDDVGKSKCKTNDDCHRTCEAGKCDAQAELARKDISGIFGRTSEFAHERAAETHVRQVCAECENGGGGRPLSVILSVQISNDIRGAGEHKGAEEQGMDGEEENGDRTLLALIGDWGLIFGIVRLIGICGRCRQWDGYFVGRFRDCGNEAPGLMLMGREKLACRQWQRTHSLRLKVAV